MRGPKGVPPLKPVVGEVGAAAVAADEVESLRFGLKMAPRLPPVAGVGRPPGGTRIERVGGDGTGVYGVAIADPTAFATLPAEDRAERAGDDGDVASGAEGRGGDA